MNPPSPPVVAILLAAGRGRRFGADKRFAAVRAPDGTVQPLAVASARVLVDAGLETVAVVRPGDDELARSLEAIGIAVVRCPNADEGMGASLAFGVQAKPDAAGWLVALADMPWLRRATVAALARAVSEGAAIVAPLYEGRRGHPVGFARRFRRELAACAGDTGARPVLEAHHAEVSLLPVDDPGVLRDVDEPAQLD